MGKKYRAFITLAMNTRYGRNDRIRTCDIVVPNHARYQLRYIPKNIKLNLSSCPLRFLLQLRLCHREYSLATRQVAATSYSSLYHPTGALGNVPNCATSRCEGVTSTHSNYLNNYRRFYAVCQALSRFYYIDKRKCEVL